MCNCPGACPAAAALQPGMLRCVLFGWSAPSPHSLIEVFILGVELRWQGGNALVDRWVDGVGGWVGEKVVHAHGEQRAVASDRLGGRAAILQAAPAWKRAPPWPPVLPPQLYNLRPLPERHAHTPPIPCSSQPAHHPPKCRPAQYAQRTCHPHRMIPCGVGRGSEGLNKQNHPPTRPPTRMPPCTCSLQLVKTHSTLTRSGVSPVSSRKEGLEKSTSPRAQSGHLHRGGGHVGGVCLHDTENHGGAPERLRNELHCGWAGATTRRLPPHPTHHPPTPLTGLSGARSPICS